MFAIKIDKKKVLNETNYVKINYDFFLTRSHNLSIITNLEKV